MTLFESLILGVTQGITEFLPVSSSGHIALVSLLLNLTPSLTLDIFLNTATLISVLFVFRKQFVDFIANLPYIVVGTIPALIVGVFFKNQVENLFSTSAYLPVEFLVTSVVLALTLALPKRDLPMSYKRIFVMGIFQSIAILPAISRSGMTIFAGLALGLSPINAFKYSFYLFIPASLGALVLSLKDITGIDPSTTAFTYFLTFIFTTIVGIISLRLLQKVLASRQIWLFAPYVFILSLLLYLNKF